MKETLLDCVAELAAVMRRHPWYTATIAVAALTLIAFLTLEWRAEKHWQRYMVEAQARGVKLWITDFERPAIPDAENLAALPILSDAKTADGRRASFTLPTSYGLPTGPHENIYSTPVQRSVPDFGNPFLGRKMNWADWQQYFKGANFLDKSTDQPVADVLRALEHYTPQLQQWSEWRTTRTQCRFPLDFTKKVDQQLGRAFLLRDVERVFILRLRAHLVRHDSAAAYADFQDGLQAYRALRKEPTLSIGYLRTSLLSMLVAAVGDGLKEHAWVDADLRRIQDDLGAVRVWDDWRLTLETSRGEWNSLMEALANLPRRELDAELAGILPRTDENLRRVLGFIPHLVIRDNQVRVNRYYDELLARVDAGHQTLDLRHKTPSAPENLTTPHEQAYYFLLNWSWVRHDTERAFIACETRLDETRLACALERFRLKHGTFPKSLAELSPEFIAQLPVDTDARAPFRYQRLGEASFRLYGMGENGQDDGGVLAPGVQERKQLDAIWPYAPLSTAP